MSYSPTQPVAYILDDDQLPKAVHKPAAIWRAMDNRETETETLVMDTQEAVANAQDKDAAVARQAVLEGKPVPTPLDANERLARETLEAAEAQLLLIRQEKVKAGKDLLNALIDSRAEMATMTLKQVTKAATAYEQALAKAQADVDKAAHALSESTSGFGTIEDIDADERDRYEIAAAPMTVARPDFTPAAVSLELIRAYTANLTEPEERMAVRTTTGEIFVFPRSMAIENIAHHGGVRVPTADVPADATQIGEPTTIGATEGSRW